MSAYRAKWLIAAVALTLVGTLAVAAASSAHLLVLFAAPVILAALVAAFISSRTIRAFRRRLPGVSSPSEGQVDSVAGALAYSSPGFMPFEPHPERQRSTDEQLCKAWCLSYSALQAPGSRRKFMRIVEERGGYLDELERRNPAAFAAWLASGATAAGDPLPYMSHHTDNAAINWDELIRGQDC